MNTFINSLQSAKKNLTDKIIKDPDLNDMAHKYIDAQTEFANMLVNNSECMMKYTFNNMSKGYYNE